VSTILNRYAYGTSGEKAIAESAAVLRRWYHEKGKGTDGSIILIREWKFQDKRTADTFAAALTDTVASPKADGQTYSGTFVSQKPVIEGAEGPTVVQTLVLSDSSGVTVTQMTGNGADDLALKTTATTYWFDRTQGQYTTEKEKYDEASELVTNRVVLISSPRPGTRTGLIDFTVTIVTFADRTVEAYIASRSKGGTVTKTKFVGQVAEPAALQTGEYGSVSKNQNLLGSWDGERNIIDYSNVQGLYQGQAKLTFRSLSTGENQWYEWIYTYSINYFLTPALAYANTSGGYKGGGVGKVASFPDGGGIWRATKIYKITRGAKQALNAQGEVVAESPDP